MTADTTTQRANVIIAGDGIRAGIDMEDAERAGELPCAFVVQFASREALKEAIDRGSVEFDFMRDDES